MTLHSSSALVAPTIDYSHNMRVLKLPKSVQIGALVYRLKGSDGDPNTQLQFGVAGAEARNLLDVVQVARSWNEADVFLRSRPQRAQYNISVYVSDGNTTTQVDSTVLFTESSDFAAQNDDLTAASAEDTALIERTKNCTKITSPFVNTPHVFQVSEAAQLDERIGHVTVLESRKSDLPVRFELRGKGADKFSIKYVFGPKGQSRAQLTLAQPVDYERQNLFTLQVLALNAWTDVDVDTRNVATLDIVVSVIDVQDSPPKWIELPSPTLRLSNALRPGDVVARVRAEDADYADQRPVQYALDANSPLSSYFELGKVSGELKLMRPMSELALRASWASDNVLAMFASELPDPSSYDHLWPPMYARAELALELVDVTNEPPRFVVAAASSDNNNNALDDAPRMTSVDALRGVVQVGTRASSPRVVRWRQPAALRQHRAHIVAAALEPHSSGGSNSNSVRPLVVDVNAGANGTFELRLEGADAHLFELEPSGGLAVVRQTSFTLALLSDVYAQLQAAAVSGSSTPSSLQVASASSSQDSIARTNRSLQSDAVNRVSTRMLHVDIVARDFGTAGRKSSRLRCSIEAQDASPNGDAAANQKAPAFEARQYEFGVYESAPVGEQVGAVRAHISSTDKRVARQRIATAAAAALQDSSVEYVTLSGYRSELFKLNADSGLITLAAPLDRERDARYELVAEARDPTTSLSNYTHVSVRVLDANDNAPVFTQTHYEAALQPDGSLLEPLLVHATDADEPGTANSQLAYEIIAGNQNELFAIDAITGAVYVAGQSLLQPSPSSALPPTLSEPITPFNGRSHGGGGGGLSLSSKIRPSAREIEEARSSSKRASSGGGVGDERARLWSPTLDSEQLPALDLLLNLESSHQPENTTAPRSKLHERAAAIQSDQFRFAPVTTLVVRAHDFGIPLRSATTRVSIYNLALQSRALSLILNGTLEQLEPRREAIERAYGSLTGSRAQIDAIDALTDSSSLSVARVSLAAPAHSLVDLTDLSALSYALEGGASSVPHDAHRHQLHHYAAPANITSPVTYNTDNNNNEAVERVPAALLGAQLERRLLIYIIIVAVCILLLLLIWILYWCARDSSAQQGDDKEASGGTYKPRAAATAAAASSNTTGQTQTKTLVDASAGDNASDVAPFGASAVGQQFNKTRKRQQQQRRRLDSFGDAHQRGDAAMLGLPHGKFTDLHSMYNGQVWFETTPLQIAHNNGMLSPGARLSAGPFDRRASSAPSVRNGSLDSALHSAMRAEHASARGRFFPNTLGYVHNLAALAPDGATAYMTAPAMPAQQQQQHHAKRNRHHSNARVAPSDKTTTAPRDTSCSSASSSLGGSSGASSAASVSARSPHHHARRAHKHSANDAKPASAANGSPEALVLDSDQELLGFDSTGTPIIATHTRKRSIVAPTIAPTQVAPKSKENNNKSRSASIVAKSTVNQLNGSNKNQPLSAPGAAADDEGQQQPKQETQPPSSVAERRASYKRANSVSATGGLIDELNATLEAKRRASEAEDAATQQQQRSVSSAASSAAAAAVLPGDEATRALRGMRNGELLEKQSIFALTYNAVHTQKPSAAE